MTDRTEIELCLAVYHTVSGTPPAKAVEELRLAVDAMPAELGASVQILRDGAAEFLAAVDGAAPGSRHPAVVAALVQLNLSFLAYLSDCRARDEATRAGGWGYEREADLMG